MPKWLSPDIFSPHFGSSGINQMQSYDAGVPVVNQRVKTDMYHIYPPQPHTHTCHQEQERKERKEKANQIAPRQ